MKKMKQNLNEEENSSKATNFAGSGMAIGAAIGMIFGLLMFEDLPMGYVIGAALSLVIGAVIDAQGGHVINPDE